MKINNQIIGELIKSIKKFFDEGQIAVVRCLDEKDNDHYILTAIETIPNSLEPQYLPIAELFTQTVPENLKPANKDGSHDLVASQEDTFELWKKHQLKTDSNPTLH